VSLPREELLRELTPVVLSVLVRRGADFATAEDALQEALIKALAAWADQPPDNPKAWMITTAWRAYIDLARSDSARRAREERFDPEPTPLEEVDDTLQMYVVPLRGPRGVAMSPHANSLRLHKFAQANLCTCCALIRRSRPPRRSRSPCEP